MGSNGFILGAVASNDWDVNPVQPLRTADWANSATSFWISAIDGYAVTPDIQVSTIAINKTGRVVLQSDPTIPNSNAVIAFDGIGSNISLLGYNNNVQYTNSNKQQITSLLGNQTAYDDIASSRLILYGDNPVGARPIGTFQEYLATNSLEINSQQVFTSNLYVSTINGFIPGQGSGSNTSNFAYLFANVAAISSLSVSSITDFSGGIQTSSITTKVMLTSTIAFQPSLGGFSPKIDLGMGGFLGGLLGEIGAASFNTIIAGAALATGVAGLMLPRTIAPGGVNTNLNSNNFELINGTTQLQVSTLGQSVSNILRFVSSAAPNIPGKEIFVSTIIPSGSVAIRSLSDPMNLANPLIQTSSIQAFGQWTLLPFLSNTSNTTSNVSTIDALTVSSINTVGWDTIQYWNMAPVNQGTFVVVNNSNHNLYIGATLTGYPPPGSNPQYAYYTIPLVNGHYTYGGFVNMVNAVLGQSGGPSQIQFSIDPVSHIINIQNINLNISPLTQVYTLIWNPSTAGPFASSNFSPAWTSNAVTASSQLFGAGLSNVNQCPNPPSPLVYLPNPVPLASFTGPVSFGPYLQVSTIFSASTITSLSMSTININLQTINGQPYTPGGGGGSNLLSNTISSLTVSSINTVGWDQIQFWNVAPTFSTLSFEVTAGSNDAVFMGVRSASNPLINSNTVFTVPAATYSIGTYCSSIRGLTKNGPLAFSNVGPIPGILSQDGFRTIRWLNGQYSSNPDYVYTLYFNTFQTYLFPGYTASQITAVGALQGANVNTDVVLCNSPNYADLPNPAGTSIYTTYPFSADIQVSTLTIAENLDTPYINYTSWSTIQYFNQAPTYNSNDRAYVVTSSNNILCLSAIANSPPGSTFSNIYGVLLPVGTYSTGDFIDVVNGSIQTYSQTTSNLAFKNLRYSVTFSNCGVFTNSITITPPPVNTTFYKLDFNPANYALYSNATYNLMVGSAQLFGSGPPVVYTVNPGFQAILPNPNYQPLPVAPEPFGANLQVSSLIIAGQGLISGVPTGSITMYAGNIIPPGYLQCDGSYYPINQYFNLYNALAQGQIYGVDNSNVNFAVPDLQARFPLGKYTNPNPVNITITKPNVPGSNGNILLLNTNYPSVVTTPPSSANLITSDMYVYAGSNEYRIDTVIWSGPSTTAPYSICYIVSINPPTFAYNGQTVSGYAQRPLNVPFGEDWDLGGNSLNPAYNTPLNSKNMAPHTHGSYVGKGGTNGAVDTIAVNATGFPNITYGQQPTTDGTTYFNNRAVPNSLPVGQVTPGLGFDLTPYNFSTISGFTAPNSNVTVAPTLPPYTIVNYIIKY